MELTLSDALSHYRSLSETTHRFWGYFQAIALGALAFSWAHYNEKSLSLTVLLTLAFVFFAILNLRLIRSAQMDVVEAARCLKAYTANPNTTLPPEFKPLIENIKPDSVVKVCCWHSILAIATVVVFWLPWLIKTCSYS